MFYTGLVSISFRKESTDSIIELVKENGLDGIEWGGDVHVPAGDTIRALKVGDKTRKAGLKVFSYGSYYRLGESEDPAREFSAVLESAAALGAPIIRLWAGKKDPDELSPQKLLSMADEARMLADMALERNITLAFECHRGTLTSDYKVALSFLKDINRGSLKMYWQPLQSKSEEYNLASAKAFAPSVTNIHVFHWIGKDRFPLGNGEEVWAKYLDIFEKQYRRDRRVRSFCLEFMHDDLTQSLCQTAETLRSWIKASNGKLSDAKNN